MFTKEFWSLLGQVAPLVLGWIWGNQKTKAEALDRFEGWVKQHKADGTQSANLRDQARDQASDLAARAAARDAQGVSPAALPAAGPAPANDGASSPKSGSGVPLVQKT